MNDGAVFFFFTLGSSGQEGDHNNFSSVLTSGMISSTTLSENRPFKHRWEKSLSIKVKYV